MSESEHPLRLTPEVRAWLYRIVLALVTLAALYGLIGEDEVAGWTALIGALLSSGLATANTSTHKPH